MANLLPDKYREGVHSEYRLRLASGGLGLLLICLVVSIALLVPSFLLVDSRHDQMEKTLSVLSDQKATSSKKLQSIVDRTNQELSTINEQEEPVLIPTEVLSAITQAQPEGLSLLRITAEPAEEGQLNAKLTGVAATRDTLLSFEDNLRRSSRFSSVDLPIDTLKSRRQIEFSLQVQVNSPE